jgi:hypothetical protein
MSRGQRGRSIVAVISDSRPELLFFSLKYLLNCTHKAEWINYFSENLIALGIKPRLLDL